MREHFLKPVIEKKPRENRSRGGRGKGGVWLEKSLPLKLPCGIGRDRRRAIWRVRWFDPLSGRRRSWSRQQWLRRDALAAAGQMRAQLGEFSDQHRVRWRTFVELDLDWLASHRRAATWELYERLYRRIGLVLAPTYLSDLTYRSIEEYCQRRLQRVAAPTVNQDLRHLKAAWNRGRRRGWTDADNPVLDRLFIPELEPHHESVDEKSYRRLLAACPTEDWAIIVMLGYEAALRIGEILALEWMDVHLGKPTPHLVICNKVSHPTKSGHIRTVPLAPELAEQLRRLRQGGRDISGKRSDQRERHQGTKTAAIRSSVSWGRGKVIRSTSLLASRTDRTVRASDAFAAICVKAGLTVGKNRRHRYTLHDLRRSALTRWSGAGMAIADLKQVAGHASIETTLKYYLTLDTRRQAEIIGKDSEK